MANVQYGAALSERNGILKLIRERIRRIITVKEKVIEEDYVERNLTKSENMNTLIRLPHETNADAERNGGDVTENNKTPTGKYDENEHIAGTHEEEQEYRGKRALE